MWTRKLAWYVQLLNIRHSVFSQLVADLLDHGEQLKIWERGIVEESHRTLGSREVNMVMVPSMLRRAILVPAKGAFMLCTVQDNIQKWPQMPEMPLLTGILPPLSADNLRSASMKLGLKMPNAHKSSG